MVKSLDYRFSRLRRKRIREINHRRKIFSDKEKTPFNEHYSLLID